MPVMKGGRKLQCGQCRLVVGEVANDANPAETATKYFCSEDCREKFRLNEMGKRMGLKGMNPTGDEIYKAHRKFWYGEG